MNRWRIDPSSCPDARSVDDMAVWWFRATCFHGFEVPIVLKYLNIPLYAQCLFGRMCKKV